MCTFSKLASQCKTFCTVFLSSGMTQMGKSLCLLELCNTWGVSSSDLRCWPRKNSFGRAVAMSWMALKTGVGNSWWVTLETSWKCQKERPLLTLVVIWREIFIFKFYLVIILDPATKAKILDDFRSPVLVRWNHLPIHHVCPKAQRSFVGFQKMAETICDSLLEIRTSSM